MILNNLEVVSNTVLVSGAMSTLLMTIYTFFNTVALQVKDATNSPKKLRIQNVFWFYLY